MNRSQTTGIMIACIVAGIIIGASVLGNNDSTATPIQQVTQGDRMTLYKNMLYTYSERYDIYTISTQQYVKYGGYEPIGHGYGVSYYPFFNTWLFSGGGAGRFYIEKNDVIHFGKDGQWKVTEITSDYVKFESN